MRNDGQTSYQRRWQKDHKAPLCEMAETVQYMIPTTKAQPKMEPRFFKGIWLGRDTMTGESIVGIPGKVIRARTIRRQIMPDKYDQRLLDTINAYPWNLPITPMAIPPQLLLPADNTASKQAIGTQADITVEDTSTQTKQETPLALPARAIHHQPMDMTMATSPLATSPTTMARPPLPLPPASKRQREEPTGEAQSKQSRTAQSSTAANRGQDEERPKAKMRIQAVTITTKKGDKITTASCEDEQEADVERMLQEPFVYDNEGLDPLKVQQGMKKEAQSMKTQGVFTEMNYNDVPEERKNRIIESKWVNKPKQDEVRCRIVAQGYLETIQHLCEHANLWDLTHPIDNGAAQPLDNTSRRCVNSIPTCASSNRQPIHVATTRTISKRSQHNHSMEAQQSNLWTTIKSKILAGSLCTSPTTNGTVSTDK